MQRWQKGLLIGLVIGTLGVLFGLLPIGLNFERSIGLKWLFAVRGATAPPPSVAVVGINGQTGTDLGIPAAPRDWPRSIHTKLLGGLAALGAEVVVFDIHFASEKDPSEDARFIAAVKQTKNIVLFEKLTGKMQPIMDASGDIISEVWAESLVEPMPGLAEAATGLGIFPLPKIDVAVHEFWTFKSTVGYEPSMPAIALQLRYASLPRRGPSSSSVSAEPLLLEALPGRAARSDQWREYMRKTRKRFLESSTKSEGLAATQPEVAALYALYTGAEHRYLNFYGPPGTIHHLRYQDVVNRSGDPVYKSRHDLTGSVVFVGYADLYDPGQPDRFYTVFTNEAGVDLGGVEIAATAYANLLEDSALKPLDTLQAVALLFLFGFALSVIVYQLPAIYGAPLALACCIGYAVTAQWLFAKTHWLPIATPLLVQAPLALFLGLMGQYLFERRKGQRISEAINYYLPENIARDLASGTVDQASANKVVYSTCFATDMAGFSTLAEGMNPGDLAKFLNEYFENLSAPLKKNGVDVTEFRADAIMCAWISDQETETIRRKALTAALEAKTDLAKFMQRHDNQKTSLRIGLECGWVYVGHAGGGGHFVYSIVGDSANAASRLENLNKHLGTEILASSEVCSGIDEIAVRRVGQFQLKGKTDAVGICEVIAKADEIDQDRLALNQRYAEALAAFEAQDPERAQSLFSKLAEDYPEDGPTAFFLKRIQTAEESSGIIVMSEK